MPVKDIASIFANKKSQGYKECGYNGYNAPTDKNMVENLWKSPGYPVFIAKDICDQKSEKCIIPKSTQHACSAPS